MKSTFEESTGNVYQDLGFEDAADMLVKAQLATKIAEIIKAKKLKQKEAAAMLEMPQSKLSKMLRGQFRGISETKMMNCLMLLGRDVKIVIGPTRRHATTGRLAVDIAA